ncbi:MAG: hypothetical protein M1818_007570 [Claussenomyces sp. TS43310]|nr:MAG: hypothetical protein M1818_007570 [Claussenomyces sp. TS43310]
MAFTRSSSAAITLTGSMASPARDIPKPPGRDSFAAVAARSMPADGMTTKHSLLPTPPNSISPSLPPLGLKARAATAMAPVGLDPIESDLDLHVSSAESMTGGDGDSTGAITPSLLAKHHLPDILLSNGPLAIRHIMGYLTTSVPGFSGIPPAKARRLVVGALEGRGSGGEGGGLHDHVKFEKVGWGRWDARIKGQAPRHHPVGQLSPPLDPHSSPRVGMPINNPAATRPRHNVPVSSWAGESAFSHEDEDMDITMLENEADKMSLDGGDESCSSSEAPPDDELMDDDPGDVTDEEDWAAVGAAGLRQASQSASGPGRHFFSHVYTAGSQGGGGGAGASLLTLAKSAPLAHYLPPLQQQQQQQHLSSLHTSSDSQEREAIEALLRLGSV